MALHVKIAGIPAELKHIPQWVLWRRTEDKGNGRFGKQPINRDGYPISVNDPKNWRTFETAIEQLRGSPKAAGIGICLAGELLDTRYGMRFLIGIDIDKCVQPASKDDGIKLTPKAESVLQTLGSYWELSPSGTGVRAFFYSAHKPRGRNVDGFELYVSGRFLTVTGSGAGEMADITETTLRIVEGLMFSHPTPHSPMVGPATAAHAEKAENPESVGKLQAALDLIPPGISRDQWRNALLSIKAHGFSCGEAMARKWSESAGLYDAGTNPNGYEEKAFDDVWRCNPQAITPATVYYLANQYRQATQPITYGDTFNGQVFAELHHGNLKYVYPVGRWIRWDGAIWAWCKGNEGLDAAKRAAEEVLRRATEEFKKDPGSTEAKRKVAHAQQSFNLKRLESMQVCAAAEAGMHVGEMYELDADPMLLGCSNGVIDLRTGQLQEPQREMLITKQVAADYLPDAPCPNWERFLQQVMLEDEETIGYLQKAVGYTLTGMVSEEVMHFAFGGGRNGKSVLANILRRLFNDYAVVAPAEMLMNRDRGSGANNDVARLVGARLLLANETRNGQAMDDLTLKTLVSTENISARFLHKEYFEFKPTHCIWMRGNHKPLIRDESEGAWRRIRLIPFELDLAPEDVDAHLEEKLWAEREGILAWAVRGCLRWQKEGLNPSPRIKSASATYRKDCDLFGEFLEDNCILDRSAKIIQQALWLDYQEWCSESGVRPGSKKAFTRRLEERGVLSGAYIGKDRAYLGIRRRTSQDNADTAELANHSITGLRGNLNLPLQEKSLEKKPQNTLPSREHVVGEDVAAWQDRVADYPF